MDKNKFVIEVVDQNGSNLHEFVAECHTFAEAARYAYAAKNSLGLDWKIISVHLLQKKEKEE